MTIARPPRAFPFFESIAALAVVAGFVALQFMQLQEARRSLPQSDSFSSYDAHPGGYQAWYDLLRSEGVRAERFEKRPAFLDASIDTFIVAGATIPITVAAASGAQVLPYDGVDFESLARWTKAGGNLVVIGDSYGGIAQLKTPDLSETGATQDRAVPVLASAVTDGVTSVAGSAKLRVPYARGGAQTPLVADDGGAVVAEYGFGKGTVVVVSDAGLFENHNIASAQNARLAYNLATTNVGPRGAVAFEEYTHGYVAGDTLWSVLPRPLQAGLLILGIALLVLGSGAALRFGPTTRLPQEAERTSAEYVTSMATLLARGGAARKAVRDIADNAVRDAATALGLHDGAPVARIAARLQSGAQDDPRAEAVLRLNRLRSLEYPNEAELVEAGRLAATLRKDIARHARIGFGHRRPSQRRSA